MVLDEFDKALMRGGALSTALVKLEWRTVDATERGSTLDFDGRKITHSSPMMVLGCQMNADST